MICGTKSWVRRAVRRVLSAMVSTEGSNLLEFAVALPLLVVFVVGIFDFGQAFNTKQQLVNAAREGARLASSQPAVDLDQFNPASVRAVRDTVDAYLRSAKIDDCNLGRLTRGPGLLTWTATGTRCGGTFTLTIERNKALPATINTGTGTTTVQLLATRVSMSYPYQWHFASVVRLLVPDATYSGTLQIAAEAVMPNMN